MWSLHQQDALLAPTASQDAHVLFVAGVRCADQADRVADFIWRSLPCPLTVTVRDIADIDLVGTPGS